MEVATIIVFVVAAAGMTFGPAIAFGVDRTSGLFITMGGFFLGIVASIMVAFI